MPEMVLDGPRRGAGAARRRRDPPARDAPRRPCATGEIAAAAYESVGFPPEVFGFYEGLERLPPEEAAAFLGYSDGEPVSIAMTLLSHGVAASTGSAAWRRRAAGGSAAAVTAAATNAGFDLGADVASLQASPWGSPIYEAMGYETICEYRLYHSSAPGRGAGGRPT